MKKLRLDDTNRCKTKNLDIEFFVESFTQIRVTLDTFPLNTILNIISSLGFVEKHVIRFVCKKFHSIVHRMSVSNK
jgi:hypothetical protein